MLTGGPNNSTQAIQDAIVDTLRYTVHCANFYFRTSREHGVFVPHEVRLLVAAAGENMVETRALIAQPFG